MNWNYDELINTYEQLKDMLKSSKGKKRLTISYDLCVMSSILSFFNWHEESEFKFINDLEDDYELLDFLSDRLSEIVINLHELSLQHINMGTVKNARIDDYQLFLNAFLSEYYPKINTFFNEMVSNNRIQTSVNKKINDDYDGECFYNITFNQAYILSKFDGKILTSAILPHEIGHAYQATVITKAEMFRPRMDSLFVEVYSTYLELLFYDYLSKIGYLKQANYLLRKYWLQFNNMIEISELFLLKSHSYLKCDQLKYIFSMLLSNLFFLDYLNNHNHKSFNEFAYNFTYNDDLNIINYYGFDNILESGKSRILTLKNSIK